MNRTCDARLRGPRVGTLGFRTWNRNVAVLESARRRQQTPFYESKNAAEIVFPHFFHTKQKRPANLSRKPLIFLSISGGKYKFRTCAPCSVKAQTARMTRRLQRTFFPLR